MSGQNVSLEDLVTRFQSASESLERSYRELRGRVRSLTAELEREREERIRLERLTAMGEMSLELAHEIRNPLGSIELYASMLEGEYAEQIVRSVRLLNHSLTNALRFGEPIAVADTDVGLPAARRDSGISTVGGSAKGAFGS
jgi:signal transduction histidine kinase